MLRRSSRRLFFPGMQGGGGGGNNNQQQQGANALAQMMQQRQQQQGGGAGAGGGLNPEMMQQMREQMKNQLQSNPQLMQQKLKDAMSNMAEQNGGNLSMGIMGVGENERGKKVAKGMKIDFNLKTGKMSHEIHEKQLDPDDAQISGKTREDFEEEGECIEVVLEEDNEKLEKINESEIEIEDSSHKK